MRIPVGEQDSESGKELRQLARPTIFYWATESREGKVCGGQLQECWARPQGPRGPTGELEGNLGGAGRWLQGAGWWRQKPSQEAAPSAARHPCSCFCRPQAPWADGGEEDLSAGLGVESVLVAGGGKGGKHGSALVFKV